MLPNRLPGFDANNELPVESSCRCTEGVFDGGERAMTFPGTLFNACKAKNWSELLSLSIVVMTYYDIFSEKNALNSD